jgi:uncharacterized membrane protein YeiH
MLGWDLLTIIGTIAFAASGAVVAIEEEYDILGIYVLGFVTAFGGGAVRNLVTGIPINLLWEQTLLFTICLISVSMILFFPYKWIDHLKRWTLFDAIGLASFAIQGALIAKNQGLPFSAVLVAAVLTGAGGGVIRDILAKRKPIIFRKEIYALWALLAGLAIATGLVSENIGLYMLLCLIVVLRMISVKYEWTLPKRFTLS